MTNNDVLRQLRFILNYNDLKMLQTIERTKYELPQAMITAMLKKDDDPQFRACVDKELCRFLDGLIIEKRGLREGDPIPKPTSLNNNLILRKLRIAFNLKDVEMLSMFDKAGFRLSKGELNALFQKPEHKNFQVCGDQILRNFLKGLSLTLRAGK